MVVSSCRNKNTEHVEFVSYTGSFPNLCSGVLTLKIDGVEVKFGHDYRKYDWKTGKYSDNNYESFWSSGGGLDSDYCPYQGEWIIDERDIPDEYKKYIYEIDRVFNANVNHGCCGGCA